MIFLIYNQGSQCRMDLLGMIWHYFIQFHRMAYKLTSIFKLIRSFTTPMLSADHELKNNLFYSHSVINYLLIWHTPSFYHNEVHCYLCRWPPCLHFRVRIFFDAVFFSLDLFALVLIPFDRCFLLCCFLFLPLPPLDLTPLLLLLPPISGQHRIRPQALL